jgi:hypothetical protein
MHAIQACAAGIGFAFHRHDPEAHMDWRVVVVLAVVGCSIACLALVFRKRQAAATREPPGESARPAVHIDSAFAVSHDDNGPGEPSAPATRSGTGRPRAVMGKRALAAAVQEWVRGRRCASCGGELIDGRMAGRHVALLEPDGTTREWLDVAPEQLPLALATSLPICWNCNLAATFRRKFPQLVVDRDDDTVHVKHGPDDEPEPH